MALKALVTFALENEFTPWRAMREFHPGKWGAAEAHFAEIGGAEVGVVLTGIGPRKAALEASKVTWGESGSIEFCISSGLAGALRPEYQIGPVLAARAMVRNGAGGDADSKVLESSEPLISFAAECGATVVDRFYSADHVVGRADEKRHLGLTAGAVEMESFEILLQAEASGIPGVAIRAISDGVDENLPLDMNQVFTEEGHVSIPRVLGQVARHPQSLPGLVRLGQQSKRAAESLAKFLDRYLLKLAEKTGTLDPRVAAAVQEAGK